MLTIPDTGIVLGEFVSLQKNVYEDYGLECYGVVLDEDRIAVIVRDYDLSHGQDHEDCRLEGIIRHLRWRPRFVEGKLMNKESLVTPSIPELMAISELCKDKFGLMPSHNFLDVARYEIRH